MAEERDGGYVRRVEPSEQNPRLNTLRPPRDGSPEGSRPGDDDRERDGSDDTEEAGRPGSGDRSGSGTSSLDDDRDKKPGMGPGDDDDDSKPKGKKKRGSSDDDDEPGGKSKRQKKNSSVKGRLKQLRNVAAAGKAVMQTMQAAQMLLYLKSILQALMAVVQAAAAAVASAVAAIVQTVVTVVATALGVTAAVAMGGIVAVCLIAVILVGVLVGNTVNNNIATRDDNGYECNTNIEYMTMASAFTDDVNENMLINAKKVYSLLRAYGMQDIQIAGVLGNWQYESSIDATAVYGIYTEPFTYPVPGTRKGDAWLGFCYYDAGGVETRGPVLFNIFMGVAEDGTEYGLLTSTNENMPFSKWTAYHEEHSDSHQVPIGLGQWKDSRNTGLLNFASATGMPWYLPETQILYMIYPNEAGSPLQGDAASEWLAGWTANVEATPEEAAKTFCANWERCEWNEIRATDARYWYDTIQTWQEGKDYDLSYGNSLIQAVLAASSASADKGQSSGLRACSGLTFADNSSAAAAAVTFAWGPGVDAKNDGTDCWQHVNGIIINDGIRRSCDRTVATAIKWSGTDSDFRNGAVSGQHEYLVTSPRWQEVEWNGDVTKLMPGDVLICNRTKNERHIVIYVGNELVKAKFGADYNGTNTDGYCIVEGSYWTLSGGRGQDLVNSESPHVDKIVEPKYQAFRCVMQHNDKPEWTALTCVS